MKDTIQIETLRNKILILEHNFDSIKKASSLQQIQYELHQKQDVISQINDFYDSAWLKLIIVITILGILIPIIAQYFQQKNLKELTEFIRNQMNDGLDIKISELKNYNKTEIDKTILELNTSFKKLEHNNEMLTSEIDASLFFLQGQNSFGKKEFVDSTKDFLKCTYYWLNTERIERIEVMIGNIIISLKRLKTKAEIEKVDKALSQSFKMSLDEILDYMKNHKYHVSYSSKFEDVIKEIERLKKSNENEGAIENIPKG